MRSLMTYLNGRVNGEFEAYIETPEMCHEILQTRYLSAGTEMAGAENTQHLPGRSLQTLAQTDSDASDG